MALPIKIQGAVKLKGQAQFHPRKYMMGLCKGIMEKGGFIYHKSKVYSVEKMEGEYVSRTKDYTVTSKYVVMATHYPILNFPGMYFLKMYQERSYIIAVDIKEEVFSGMYINHSNPSFSFRSCQIDGKKMLLVGGSKHKTGQNKDILNSYAFLEEYIKTIYPNCEVKYRWSTQDCITLDKIPYIGEFSKMMPNMFVATGFNKWGMTSSHVAANIIADQILGNENPYADLFKATRLKAVKNRQEMANMIKQSTKSLVLDKMSVPEDEKENLQEGEGKVIKIDGDKVGICKIDGNVYKINPVCSHLGCELSFNSLDKTWDCPCHGSRFDHLGKSIESPSVSDLEGI